MSDVPESFFADLTQEVLESAEADDLLLPTAFTAWAGGMLEEAGAFAEAIVVDFKRTGVQLDGYAFDEDNTVLSLLVTNYELRRSVETFGLPDARAHVKRAVSFFEKSCKGLHEELEESSLAFDAALEINALQEEIQQVRFVVLTDGSLKKTPEAPELPGVAVTVDVWDIDRLHRLASSGRRQEAIRVDLEAEFDTAWPCLPAEQTSEAGYSVYLCLVPGRELAEIYERFGPRLLELNVRSFLQARGKVNKGIRDTILKEPGRFLAYNNGITATASKVRVVDGPNGGRAIAELHELQIVNGGQTSASLHRALVKDKADLDGVTVMAKITVVDDVDELQSFVPLVSRFSNSQNKVSEADFAANEDLHVQVEKLSRTIWAPAPDGGSHMTRWFYERARGQYNDEIGRLRTPAKRRQYREQHPTSQKFTKTDLAKFEHAWQSMPTEVSKGAQRNFLLFQERLKEDYKPTVDELYFQQLIAKAILFRRTEKLVSELHLGGYRANVVAFTLGLLGLWSEHRMDLEWIWRHQRLPESYERAIQTVARHVFDVISFPPGGKNVTEWAKQVNCWTTIQEKITRHTISPDFWDDLVASRQDTALRSKVASSIQQQKGKADQLKTVTPQAYFAAEIWAKQNSNLTALDMRAMQNAAFMAADQGKLSRRDAERAHDAVTRLVSEGFDHPDLGPYRRV